MSYDNMREANSLSVTNLGALGKALLEEVKRDVLAVPAEERVEILDALREIQKKPSAR